MKPRPDTARGTKESLSRIKGGPWDPSEVITQDSCDKPSPSMEETQAPQPAEPVPRSFRITQDKLERFGYTGGFPKCEAMRRGDEHDDVHHSTACRGRIETEMGKGEVLSKTLVDIENRTRGFLARMVETTGKERVDAERGASG